jgi:hypothetical protein
LKPSLKKFILKTKNMANQEGIVNITGTIGNYTFFKTQDGFRVRSKGGVSASRIKTDPNFQRTRENGQEFGSAGKSGKVLRSAFRPLLQEASDSRMVSRLTQSMMKVIQADATSTRGQRNVLDGELELLTGFDFNNVGAVNLLFTSPFTPAIDRVTGKATVNIPGFVPAKYLSMPTGATHFVFAIGAAEIDFQTEEVVAEIKYSAELPINNMATAAINLEVTLPAASTKPLFLVFGISFLIMTNGIGYPLKGASNGLKLVKVDSGV